MTAEAVSSSLRPFATSPPREPRHGPRPGWPRSSDPPTRPCCEVVRDQTERLQIPAELAAAEAERRVYADRERIARDLHDRVIQRIFAAGMGLQGVQGLVASPELAGRLASLSAELDEAVRDIRTSVFTLRRGPGDFSFRGQLIDIGEHTAEALGFRPRIDFRGPVDLATPAHIAEQSVAVVREALANVAKHAHATSAEVTVRVDSDRLTIVVADDGRGIRQEGRRSGLRNLAERAERLGGSSASNPLPAAAPVSPGTSRCRLEGLARPSTRPVSRSRCGATTSPGVRVLHVRRGHQRPGRPTRTRRRHVLNTVVRPPTSRRRPPAHATGPGA